MVVSMTHFVSRPIRLYAYTPIRLRLYTCARMCFCKNWQSVKRNVERGWPDMHVFMCRALLFARRRDIDSTLHRAVNNDISSKPYRCTLATVRRRHLWRCVCPLYNAKLHAYIDVAAFVCFMRSHAPIFN